MQKTKQKTHEDLKKYMENYFSYKEELKKISLNHPNKSSRNYATLELMTLERMEISLEDWDEDMQEQKGN